MSVATLILEALNEDFPVATKRQLGRYVYGLDAKYNFRDEQSTVFQTLQTLQESGLVDLQLAEVVEPISLASGPSCIFRAGLCLIRPPVAGATRTPVSLNDLFIADSDVGEEPPIAPPPIGFREYSNQELRHKLYHAISNREIKRKTITVVVAKATKKGAEIVKSDFVLDPLHTSIFTADHCLQLNEMFLQWRESQDPLNPSDQWIHGAVAGPIRKINTEIVPDAILVRSEGHFHAAMYFARLQNLDQYLRVLRTNSEKHEIDAYLW